MYALNNALRAACIRVSMHRLCMQHAIHVLGNVCSRAACLDSW